MKTKLICSMLLVMGVALATGCRKDEADGKMMVMMTDAPGVFQQVNVEIRQVRVHTEKGWMDLPTNSGVYNLLTLQNGVQTALVAATPAPAGKVDQMRLVLGSNNTVMVDNIVYPLSTPSGSESGIKIKNPIFVQANSTTVVLIDFNAQTSVVLQGNGTYQLKPVIEVVQ